MCIPPGKILGTPLAGVTEKIKIISKKFDSLAPGGLRIGKEKSTGKLVHTGKEYLLLNSTGGSNVFYITDIMICAREVVKCR
jgi:hypothetical protein